MTDLADILETEHDYAAARGLLAQDELELAPGDADARQERRTFGTLRPSCLPTRVRCGGRHRNRSYDPGDDQHPLHRSSLAATPKDGTGDTARSRSHPLPDRTGG